MLETYKELLIHQFEAVLCTLNACIDPCPESGWNERVGNVSARAARMAKTVTK
jgi:hypothetical protein